MRIVIDLQAVQSPGSRNRGIGRYSIALARAMLRHRGEHEILIALNGMYADTVQSVRETFDDLLPQDQIHVWHATVPPLVTSGAPVVQRRASELVRESFLASLNPDIVHVSSLFEIGPYSVAGVHGKPWGLRTAVTLYDLIPYIYPDVYLPQPQARLEYDENIAHLRAADVLLAISESSRQEAIHHLGMAQDHVVNISSAADEHFTMEDVPYERETVLRARWGLLRPFVMYTGGIDHRKNVEGLIVAWAALPVHLRLQHQLAIVCSVQDVDRLRLENLMREQGLAPGEVVLTGFVAEEDLVDLYRLCKLFVFPSKHEGFGLPALEAMRCGAPVIGANNSSIPEVIGRADALFDAHSLPAITHTIEKFLRDDELRADLARHGREQAMLFSWDESAKKALAAMEAVVARSAGGSSAAPSAAPTATAASPAAGGAADAAAPGASTPATPAKPRLAFVTPMPPQRSGIADSSADVLPELARHYDIDLILDQEQFTEQPEGSYRARRSVAWFEQHAHEYDRILYQFGNSAFHDYEFDLLQRHPGVVILHDFFLSGVAAYRELDGGRPAYWTRVLYESHGWRGFMDRVHTQDLNPIIYGFPANYPVLRRATGVVVHSEHAQRLARAWYGAHAADAWAHVPLLRRRAPAIDRQAARERLQLPADAFIVCSFGHLARTKLNPRLLHAWRRSALGDSSQCRLYYVGELSPGEYGDAFSAELSQRPGNVRVTGWVSPEQYMDYLAAADVAVQLRTLSRGETSAAVLDCMNHGLPTIVNREGSMADLDRQAVWLLPDGFSDSDLARALESLWADPDRRAHMSERGRQIVHTEHAPAACAAAYAQAIEAFASRPHPVDVLLPELARELGSGASRELTGALARAIAQNHPEPRPAPQILVDVGDAKSGSMGPLVDGLTRSSGLGWRVEPVYRDGDTWRYARERVQRVFHCPALLLADDPIDVQPGDYWLTVTPEVSDAQEGSDAPNAPIAPEAAIPQRVKELNLARMRIGAGQDPALVWAMLGTLPPSAGQRQWFIDISELVRKDWRSGIQRVVKNDLVELLRNPPPETRVLPVYATPGQTGYRIARRFAMQAAGIEVACEDDAIEPSAGDTFFGLDLQPHIVVAQADYLAQLKARGVRIGFMVYDLLPIRLPDCFFEGGGQDLERWLRVVSQGDLAVCISQATADDLAAWLAEKGIEHHLRIEAVHLGADLAHAMPSRGRTEASQAQLDAIRARPSFLMVGTIEPRKSHAAVLAAFEDLWSRGIDAGLVIAGRGGWMVEALVEKLRSHPELGQRLFWFEDSSDEFLQELYGACVALVAASRGEGFGLPLVEAAQHGLPVVARDLPVFREVAGEHAFYFGSDSPQALSRSLEEWLALHTQGRQPSSKGMPWLTWTQSAERLRQVLAG